MNPPGVRRTIPQLDAAVFKLPSAWKATAVEADPVRTTNSRTRCTVHPQLTSSLHSPRQGQTMECSGGFEIATHFWWLNANKVGQNM